MYQANCKSKACLDSLLNLACQIRALDLLEPSGYWSTVACEYPAIRAFAYLWPMKRIGKQKWRQLEETRAFSSARLRIVNPTRRGRIWIFLKLSISDSWSKELEIWASSSYSSFFILHSSPVYLLRYRERSDMWEPLMVYLSNWRSKDETREERVVSKTQYANWVERNKLTNWLR